MLQKILKLASLHKLGAVIITLVLLGTGYFGYRAHFGNKSEIRYVTAATERGTIIISITGSGQTSVSNQVDVKPKVSGDAVYVGARNGQEVKKGTLLVQLDASDAEKAVRDAQVSLESAQLSLEKLKKPADQLSILQSENALAKAQESKQKAQDDLKKAYDDGFNTISNAFLDLPAVMTGLHDMLFTGSTALGGSSQWNIDYYTGAAIQYDDKATQYKTDTNDKYAAARTFYDTNFQNYKSTNRSSDAAAIEIIINQTYDTTKSIAEAIKSANNIIQFYKDKLTEHNLKPASLADTHLASLNTYTGETNAHLLNLLNAKDTIKNDKDAIVNADRTIAENAESLAKLKAGADSLDIQSQELTIKQRENALLDAQEKLADYFIRAPFDGIAAKINFKTGDPVAANAAIATIVTKQRIAEISLNEVDVAKVKAGEKVTLTFDAVPDLNITGEVAEIDTIGAISQGVVTYTVKIGFDTQDERIKPGMSVSAAIITDVKQNVILVPNAAVKTSGTTKYVEILTGKTPVSQTVETGLVNDTATEIVSGLKEGDKVVTQTITANTSSQTQTQTNSGLRIPGLTGGGGSFRGGVRD